MRHFDGAITAEHLANGKEKSATTTQLVSKITLSNGRTISYKYDEEERITKVIDSVDGTTVYTYDALGQLLTETVNGVVVNTMIYDNYGNIRTKNGKTYAYDSTWKDLLTSYNGQSITYDAQGNPTSYLGHTLTWEKGRQLKSFDNNTYTYNANGIRTSKKVNGVLHTYTLDGTKNLRETWGNNTLVPLYDNEDGVCGILYNNVPYYFIKNLQGDVIALELNMKKILIFIIVSFIIICLFFTCEIVMIRKGIDMPNQLRYIFGGALMLISLLIPIYLIGSKILKYNLPDFILTNIIELIVLAILIFIASIVLLIKK